ncbi:Stealth CR1 domain-containing protein [Palleronia sp. LCG004]|uniref:Stealth CR1 domain-containing protein n=1 Tax=Palleronia sp. LCG004 TaxID=3079304 RepID=UPI00294264A3|nr:Stealth CR1 domain-containing protein [Palleronia sp. LCG004]WOI55452.1 Stealth CR1 domain-containing protein [Palleronia sp. LCG004]
MTIDAVIAWVDGADPVHRAARAEYAQAPADGDETRFVQSGEIYVAIASILKFAPFIRRIFLVTDNQVPADLELFAASGLSAPDGIEVVDHDVIFNGLPAARPNFNTRAIEGAMHRIPGLSPSFVYFNDDMFLNSTATPGDFFQGGLPVLRGEMIKTRAARPLFRAKSALKRAVGRPDTRPSHLVSQEVGARLMGFERTFLRVPHVPHPLRVPTIEEALAAHPGLLDAQVWFRFRDRAQYSAVSLANHAEMAQGVPVLPSPDLVYLRDGRDSSFADDLARIADGAAPYACLQGVEGLAPERRRDLMETLVKRFASHLPNRIRERLLDPDQDARSSCHIGGKMASS